MNLCCEGVLLRKIAIIRISTLTGYLAVGVWFVYANERPKSL